MPEDKCYLLNPKLVLRQEGREGFVYNSETGALDLLNQTGVSILKLCNGKNTRSQIAEKMIRAFGGDRGVIAQSTAVFLREMVKRHVIAEKK